LARVLSDPQAIDRVVEVFLRIVAETETLHQMRRGAPRNPSGAAWSPATDTGVSALPA
jgi:hypothetical protein